MLNSLWRIHQTQNDYSVVRFKQTNLGNHYLTRRRLFSYLGMILRDIDLPWFNQCLIFNRTHSKVRTHQLVVMDNQSSLVNHYRRRGNYQEIDISYKRYHGLHKQLLLNKMLISLFFNLLKIITLNEAPQLANLRLSGKMSAFRLLKNLNQWFMQKSWRFGLRGDGKVSFIWKVASNQLTMRSSFFSLLNR